MSFTDTKYLNLISSRLRNFKKKSDSLWNFSCPLCGDSEKNPLKARGYVYERQNNLFYKCHNCGAGTTFSNFLKQVDENQHKQYIRDNYESGRSKFAPVEKPIKEIPLERRDPVPFHLLLPTIEQLDKIVTRKKIKHDAVTYLKYRKIPIQKWNKLYYVADFKKWSEEMAPGLFKDFTKDFDAIIIPFVNKKQELIGYQGRAYNTFNTFRYSTVRLKKDVDMIYGMDQVDLDEHIYIVEGPFDSMFLPNAIALRSSTVQIPREVLKKNNFTIIFDNEPRNFEIIRQLQSYARKGYNICVWNEDMSKDINQSILDGHDIGEILQYIKEHTYSDLSAHLELNKWKKIKEKYHAKSDTNRGTAFRISG